MIADKIETSNLTKIACYTDIHFGKKSNSEVHNQDCMNFIDWFYDRCIAEKVSHIFFLGDFFENRANVNILTLTYAHKALLKLNSLNIPIFHVIGNHDLYHRTNRNIFSPFVFSEFTNVTLISHPTLINDDILLCPYLFPEEYPLLMQYKDVPLYFGHFEFKNFVVTGSTVTLERGNDHKLFKNQDFIFSGHFHKRQFQDNVIFIGNTFPMDYGDVSDIDRGMMIFDKKTNKPQFINWPQCPTYVKITLSKVLDGATFLPDMRVKCILDVDISYSEMQTLREVMIETYRLREFQIEENVIERAEALDGEIIDVTTLQLENIDEMVKSMLKTGIKDMTKIKPDTLIEIYESL